jgi:beta-glucosidase
VAVSGAAHAIDATTGGAIVSEKRAAVRRLEGTSTARVTVAITGDVHEVTLASPRLVTVQQESPALLVV